MYPERGNVSLYPENEDVQRLVQKFNPTKISETLPTSEYTAYSENKGEKPSKPPEQSLKKKLSEFMKNRK